MLVKNKFHKENITYHIRLTWLFALVILLSLGLIARLIYLQIIQFKRYETLS